MSAPVQVAAMTDLFFALFRTNNHALAWGDRLVGTLGLTSARWQVMGAIELAEHQQPVASIARNLEANRQNVQRIVNELQKNDLVHFVPNPHHRRAHLVALTAKGRRCYAAATRLYEQQVKQLAEGMSSQDVKAAQRVMALLRDRLGRGEASG